EHTTTCSIRIASQSRSLSRHALPYNLQSYPTRRYDALSANIRTLSLHDALPISDPGAVPGRPGGPRRGHGGGGAGRRGGGPDVEIGRAHVLTPVTVKSRMPSSA